MLLKVMIVVCSLATSYAVWQNDWDRYHFGSCGGGNYIRGIKSIHDNVKEDRRWEVICGKIGSINANVACHWSGFVNSYDEMLAFNCKGNRIMTGMMSQHDNGKEDRQFRFNCCAVSGRTPSNCAVSGYANGWDAAMDFKPPANKVITGAFSYHLNSKEDRRWKFMLCDI